MAPHTTVELIVLRHPCGPQPRVPDRPSVLGSSARPPPPRQSIFLARDALLSEEQIFLKKEIPSRAEPS